MSVGGQGATEEVEPGDEVGIGKCPGAGVLGEIVERRDDEPGCILEFCPRATSRETPIERLQRGRQQPFERGAIAGQQEVLCDRVEHARGINAPFGVATDPAIGLLLAVEHGGEFLFGHGEMSAQSVEHVIHVNRLVDRPIGVELAVGEVRVRQVNARHAVLVRSMTRQHQGVPEVRAEEIVHRRLRHLEPCPAVQPILPVPHRLPARPSEIERGQLSRGVRRNDGRGELQHHRAGFVRGEFADAVELDARIPSIHDGFARRHGEIRRRLRS